MTSVAGPSVVVGLPFSRLLHIQGIEQTTGGIEDTIICQQGVVLGRDVAAASLEQFVLRVQHVQQGPLAQAELLFVGLYGVIAGVHVLFEEDFCLASDSLAFQARRVPSST